LTTLRRTPCVGICSTTYGDLVCRGCKRFAHEIVMWNSFADAQRETVWERLNALREGATARFLAIDDHALLLSTAERLRIPGASSFSPINLAYEVLRRLARRVDSPADLGIRALEAHNALALLDAIEREFYARSLAEYEHSYRTPAQ
jgi:predicted Fe-S protein YdhL (DUF1289 family)